MPAPTHRARSPWVAVGVILVGSYAALLNITVVGVALPAIVNDLGTSGGPGVDWVVTAFLIGVVAVQPLTGWAADRVGRKRVYGASLIVFALGSLLCAVAPGMTLLVAARVVQGAGAGAVMPIGMATVYDLFPPERRGTAMGVWGVAVMAAPAVGPPVGGWMVTAASWRLLFVVFGVIAVAAAVLSVRYLPDVGHRERRPLDLIGWVLSVVGVVAIVIVSRELPSWGVTSPVTLLVAGVGVGAIVAVVLRSLSHPHPIIEFRMFAVPAFAAGMVVVWLSSTNQFGQLTFLPVELQVVRDLDPGRVGLLLAPAALGVAATMPLGGWLVDRVGARVPVFVGLAVMAIGTFQLAGLRPDGSELSLVIVLIVIGVGQGFVFVPTTVAAMSSLSDRFVAQASVVNSLNRQLSGAVGVAVFSAIVVADLGAVAPLDVDVDRAQAAYNRVFLVSAWTCVAGLVACWWLPGRRRMQEHHRDRSAERTGDEPAESRLS
ncbi:MAG: DHA2 family efflux MFS transporter permease subunit [Ilumatobacter sp.]|nr:MAG: DHA2 family efflux MFS transporter permease subunit [Ilumatobacter sp.]